LTDTTLEPADRLLSGISAELFEIKAEIALGSASEVGFNLRGTPLLYDTQERVLSCKDKKIQLTPAQGRIRLHILVDRTSIEVFPNYGRVTMHFCFPLDTSDTSVHVFARGGRAKIKTLNLWKLKSIWPTA